MRKLAAIIMSALIGLTPMGGVAMAQNKAPAKKTEQQVKKQQWKKGGKYSGRGSNVSNHSRYKLQAPPKGHRWVRDGNDFLLVATATGVIASVVRAAGN